MEYSFVRKKLMVCNKIIEECTTVCIIYYINCYEVNCIVILSHAKRTWDIFEYLMEFFKINFNSLTTV